MGGASDEPVGAGTYDHIRAAESLLRWLDRWGLDGVPEQMIPPLHQDELRKARREAERVAEVTGRLGSLKSYRRRVTAWAFDRFRTQAEFAGIFAMHFSPVTTRVEGIEVVLDAMTAYLLADVLDEHDTTTLMARFDVWLGGPLFKLEEEG